MNFFALTAPRPALGDTSVACEMSAWIAVRKASAAQEGARQAWAMLQMHYPSLDIRKVAEVGPKVTDGKEMKPYANFERVMLFARITEKHCHMKRIID